MNANQKILDILIAEMGAETILAICQERVAASKKAVPPSSPPPAHAPSDPPKAPIKIVGKKVVVKKDEAVKNLEPELKKVAASSSSSFTCPPCGKGEGGDHRLCVLNDFNCDVAAWESACGLRPAALLPPPAVVPVASEEAPAAPKGKSVIVIKKVVKKEAAAPAPASKEEEPKKVVRAKKVSSADVPRCDARIYGEQIEMEGTKAPNGKPLHCFRPAQCERKGGITLAISEDNEIRRLQDGEKPAEDEGSFHVCKVCLNRWEARSEHAENWHGFFDDDGAPETSHFLNGAWYKKKMAAAAAKDE
jgi:hypothetical protein